MGIKGNNITDIEVKRHVKNLSIISTNKETHTLAYVRWTARKMQNHE